MQSKVWKMWKRICATKRSFKFYLLAILVFMLLMSGYYEYIVSVSFKSTQYFSSLHVDFEAKSYTDVSVNISKKNELQAKPNISCGATPKGKNLQNLLHQGRIFYGLRFVRNGEDQ